MEAVQEAVGQDYVIMWRQKASDVVFLDEEPRRPAAAIDRVVHHSVIVEFGSEMTGERAEEATKRNRLESDDRVIS